MLITKTSPFTGLNTTLDLPVTQAQFDDWNSGRKIQDAMPNLTPAQREFIMTGYTQEDWDQMFSGEED